MELESFVNISLRFPMEANGIATTKGNSGLITYSSMVNLLLRYPGRYIGLMSALEGDLQVESSTMRIFQVGMTKILKWHRAPGHIVFWRYSVCPFRSVVCFREIQIQCSNYHMETNYF